tara:strand:+ start:247 stop:696 length:450 start_codon:yes stop_codon:yes gene_type:complete
MILMMELPFELYKKHKSTTKSNWKIKGLITDDFDTIYKQYIYASNCELCGNKYKSRHDRQMEHNHETGKFRNICCQQCNLRKGDIKMQSNNTSGHKHIDKNNDPTCKQGFRWRFSVRIDGKSKAIKTSVDLEKLIKFRDQWIVNNNYYT